MGDKIEVFIAFDKEDVALLRELKNHLRPLETQGLITVWDASQIVGGTDWKQAINNHLKTASIILLLVSANFMASNETYNLAKQAVAKNAPPNVYVVPILLHEVDWEYSDFGTLAPLPDNRKPIGSWPNRNAAYLNVVKGIRGIVAELKASSVSDQLSSPISAANSHLDKEQSMPSTPPEFQNKPFDVFLSYNSKDRDQVKEIAKQLIERGIKPWLDVWELRPGLSWQDALEKQIEEIHAAAVFVGKEGIGPWQHMEVNAYLRQFVRGGHPVMPVLLKDAPKEPPLPTFLQEVQYVDFRKPNQDPVPMDQLIWGITGNKPITPHPLTGRQGGISTPSTSPSTSTNAPTAKMSIGELSFQQKSELVNKLLACRSIKDRHSRDRVVNNLSFCSSIPRSLIDGEDVRSIVDICLDYQDGLQELLDIISSFERDSLGRESVPMQRLRAFVASLS